MIGRYEKIIKNKKGSVTTIAGNNNLSCFNNYEPMKNPILSGTLTKKFFFTLLAGDYLVSNVYETPAKPMFAQIIKPKDKREFQWQEIVTARANGRKCHIFDSGKDHISMTQSVRFSNEQN